MVSVTEQTPQRASRRKFNTGFDRFSGLYLWALFIIVFGIWVPNEFPHLATVKQVLNANAITALAALSIIIPLTTRTFDLSFAFTMTLAGGVGVRASGTG